MAAIRLLTLTGCRKSEVLTLRWSDVDLEAGEFRLSDAKTGPRAVQLPPTAVRLLETVPRRKDSPWVFPGRSRDGRYSDDGLNHVCQTVRSKAGLNDVRLHDLRHSFASCALALGETLPVIGKLLGHSDIETTARCAHLAHDSIHDAAGANRRQHCGRHSLTVRPSLTCELPQATSETSGATSWTAGTR